MRKALESDTWQGLRIYARIFGADTVANHQAAYLDARPHGNAENQPRIAHHARAEIEALRACTPAKAVERIERTHTTEHAAREAAERALTERRRQLPARSHSRDSGPRSSGPTLG